MRGISKCLMLSFYLTFDLFCMELFLYVLIQSSCKMHTSGDDQLYISYIQFYPCVCIDTDFKNLMQS